LIYPVEMRPVRSLRASLLTGLLSLLCLNALAGEAVLRPNDVVRVKISGVPLKDAKAVSGLYVIDGQGCANMLILGKIQIAGLTVSAAEAAIESAYRSEDIYTGPTITITILSQRH
jgi:protein involved in polysaccharide export with SLBB domain